MALHFSDFQVSELIFFSARYIIYIYTSYIYIYIIYIYTYIHIYIYTYTYPMNIGCIPMIFPLLVKSSYISEIFWPDSCPVIFPQNTRRGNCSSLPPSIAMVDISWLTTDNHQLSYYHIISYHIISYHIISYHIIITWYYHHNGKISNSWNNNRCKQQLK